MGNKYIILIVGILVLLLCVMSGFVGYRLNTHVPIITQDTTIIRIDSTKRLKEFITDTLTKIHKTTIRDSVYIPNPLDSFIVKEYFKMTDSLKKLNVNYTLKLDTINRYNDTFNIECNKIKNSLAMNIRYAIRYDTTKIKTQTIYDKSWHWTETTIGFATGILTIILIGLIK